MNIEITREIERRFSGLRRFFSI